MDTTANRLHMTAGWKDTTARRKHRRGQRLRGHPWGGGAEGAAGEVGDLPGLVGGRVDTCTHKDVCARVCTGSSPPPPACRPLAPWLSSVAVCRPFSPPDRGALMPMH